MKCKQILPLLSSYIDGEASTEDEEKIETHLKDCTVCSKTLAQLRETVDSLRYIPEVSVPSELEERIKASLRAEEQAKEAVLSTDRGKQTALIKNALRYLLVFSGVMAAIIAVIIPLRAFWLVQDSSRTTPKAVESLGVQEEKELGRESDKATGKVKPAPSFDSSPAGERVKTSSVNYNNKGIDGIRDFFKEQEGGADSEIFSADTRDETIAGMLEEAEQLHLEANQLEKCFETIVAQNQTVIPVQVEKTIFEDREVWVIVIKQFSPHRDGFEIEAHAVEIGTYKILYSTE